MTAPIITQQTGRHSYTASIGKRVVGRAVAWIDSFGDFTILEVAVHQSYRRRGVARALYSCIEADAGQQLKPATSLSNDAFEFWKRYRPEAVANDLRHRRDELMGRKVEKSGRTATIISIGAGAVTARYDDATERTNSETCIRTKDLDQALSAAVAAEMSRAIDEQMTSNSNDSGCPPCMRA